jgi:ABC-type lipoprotein export system ATPase subunit
MHSYSEKEPEVPLFIEAKNLKYTVSVKPTKQNPEKKKVLLQDINAYFAPGELVAVMGPTGAGKRYILAFFSLPLPRIDMLAF